MIRANVPSGYNKLQLWNISFHLSVRSFTELKQEHNDVFFCYLGEKNLHFSNIQKIQTYLDKAIIKSFNLSYKTNYHGFSYKTESKYILVSYIECK